MSADIVFEKQIRALVDIGSERRRQDKLHPDWPDDPFERLAILTEETGEAAKDVLQGNPTLRKELIQIAAVCVRWLESISD